MRSVIALVIGIAFLPGMLAVAGPGEKLKEGKKAETVKGKPTENEKPAIRTVQAKSGSYSLGITLDPGVPDPGHVVEVSIEVAKVPPVPDPIYGEKIPLKDTEMIASVTDADGAGYTVAYRVHRMEDAGMYAFHFTPIRKDNYRLTLTGTHEGKKYEAGIRVPVGIWPFTKVDAEGNVSTVKAKPASSRLPAVPSGMKKPALPSGAAGPKAAASKQSSPFEETMQELGRYFSRAGVALLTGRRADLKEAKKAAVGMLAKARLASELPFGDPEYSAMIGELVKAIEKLDKAAAAGRAKQAVKAFRRVGSHHCNRCHFKMRWHMIENSSAFENQLP